MDEVSKNKKLRHIQMTRSVARELNESRLSDLADTLEEETLEAYYSQFSQPTQAELALAAQGLNEDNDLQMFYTRAVNAYYIRVGKQGGAHATVFQRAFDKYKVENNL